MILLGGVVGGILAMLLLSIIISAFAFKSLEPHKRAIATELIDSFRCCPI